MPAMVSAPAKPPPATTTLSNGARPCTEHSELASSRVPVQFMKIGITLRLAIADHLQAVKTGRFHPAKRLYARRRGTPRRCVFVASASPPLSSCSRHSASPLHSGFHSCLCAIVHLDGLTAPPCCWWARRLQPAQRSTRLGAASKSPDRSLRSWPPHTDSPLPKAAPPRSAVASYRSETSSASTSPRAPDATMQTSDALAQARPRRSLRRHRHALVSRQNPAVHAPSTADATAPGTSCRHCSGR